MTPPSAGEDGRLARAVKTTDSTFTTFLVTPYSKRLARWAAGRGIAPTTVTVGSIVLGLAAAVIFGLGGRAALVSGAVLLQLSFVADCVDGQLARYSGRISAFGAWLDAVGDRCKEYAVYAGLAVGSARGFGDPVWQLALAALALQVFRHTVDFGFAGQLPPVRPDVAAPSRVSGGAVGRPVGAVAPVGDASRRAPVGYWVKRSLVLPIGERFALISLMAAVSTPRATFIALLGWGLLAAAYGLAGKARRTLLNQLPLAGAQPLAGYRDDGPIVRGLSCLTPVRADPAAPGAATARWAAPTVIAAAAGAVLAVFLIQVVALLLAVAAGFVIVTGVAANSLPASRWCWLVPAAIRAAELAVVVRISELYPQPVDVPAYAFLAIAAVHYYDIVYRWRTWAVLPASWERACGIGWDGRLLVICALSLTLVLSVALIVSAAALCVLFLAGTTLAWRGSGLVRPR